MADSIYYAPGVGARSRSPNLGFVVSLEIFQNSITTNMSKFSSGLIKVKAVYQIKDKLPTRYHKRNNKEGGRIVSPL